ncbi:LCP family protein [Lysinibacillus odysseyi]|uniref:Transcriptional regulator n=1 Tax=Lysinibacillus odysseyi 34hs-1 = NBRC 100172 TaxID=1220589 RepID=A0A0A3IND2_9BACI|nr:LCP family protein [Lysinibacillus odysseyi]KGR84318.1 transcriptional regulator [Lysinibacillus odysseyi 34hs-1 = NBRC 100172]
MEDKRVKNAFSNISDRELQFTKENRDSVFEQIHKMDEGTHTQKKPLIPVKKLAPATVSLLVVGLCLFLFMPSLLPESWTSDSSSSDFHKGSNTSVASDSVIEEAEYFTTLITVKSKEMENRIYVNLLLTYNKDKKMMKIVSLPNDTYVPVADKKDGTTLYDKLLFAYNFGGAENVRTAVSKLLDLPIDYYAVIDLDTISTLIDSMDGVEYNLQEDIRIRAITQVAFEFEKGTNHLNGEEFTALLMAATEGSKLGEENLVNLLNTVMNKLEGEIPPAQLKELFTQIEANASLEHLFDNQIEINSIKSVSLIDGMISDVIKLSSTEGKHIYKFEKEFLNSVSKELTTFN